ncbi:unnamed protein product [Heligmosomoides polygyrus]|uniref:DUF4460 domain-containing protein n=1 Tax=Heligmosomoides polygyrus TaxID=6339 RepID=A0A183FJW5_HELPZ|nr:unnamed protein product [Heligmosomoides polygyrus]
MVPRGLSLNDVCAALRPFYSVVHPDRFARNPRVKEQNERSLQVFNGYLNDLFPVSGNVRPISVRFSIPSKEEDNLHDIDITLSGTDPMKIVRFVFFKIFFCKKYEPPATDLVSVLRNSRDDAIQKTLRSEPVSKMYVWRIVGFSVSAKAFTRRVLFVQVIWQMHWKESHMRSCIGNLNRLLDQANVQDSVFRALYKNTIRFGQGSYVCCDGSVQFGADNVPEQWEQVCVESIVRRSQLLSLRETAADLGTRLGGADVVIPYHKSLPLTFEQVRILNSRCVVDLYFNSYVVCSFSGYFLSYTFVTFEAKIENCRAQCELHLGLASMEWEQGLGLEELLQSMERLRGLDDSVKSLFQGLSIKLSRNPSVYVMNDGKVSVPLNWI